MLIYDIEIANAVPPYSGQREPNVEYCEGWQDYAGMGIAVIGCYDYKSDRTRVFCEDNLTEFGLLAVTQECVVGFNNQRFDERILAAHNITILPEKSYDILAEIWRSLGLGQQFRPDTHGGYGLDAMSRANFNISKSGHGANAPILWQQGKVGTVVDYCLRDIHLTKKLLDRIIRCGSLRDPKTGQTLNIRKPGA